MPQPTLLTVKEVAELLRMTEYSVRSLIHREEIEAYRIGREFRIPSDFLASMSTKKAA